MLRMKGAMFALAAGCVSAPLLAQEAEAPVDRLEDIVVFAERKARGSELQSVPMAISAVDSRLLEASHSIDLRDVGRIVPNVQLDGVGTFPGFANFFMRGIGVSTSVRSIDPAINIVQDGMVIGYQAGAILDTFDLELVEVLRGPQGVLFGRNASGGVVSVRSKRPTGAFGGEAALTVGNSNMLEFRGAVEGALVSDRLYARVSTSWRQNDGFIRNDNEGQFVAIPTSGPPGTFNVNQTGVRTTHPVGNIPETREFLVKPTIVLDGGENTQLTLLGQYQRFDNGGGASRLYLPQGAAPRSLQTLWGFTPASGRYRTNMVDTGYTDIEAWHAIAELEQQIGPGRLVAIGAHRWIRYDSTLNVGGDPFSTIVFPDNRERNSQSSIEVRYNVPLSDSLDLLVGAFWFDMETDVREFRLIRVPTSTLLSNRINFWDQRVEATALFANLDWSITPQLTFSGGLRYSRDKKDINIIPLNVCTGQNFTGCPTTVLNAERSWNDLSPRAILSYQANDDVLIYGSYTRGYRAGNFNARAVTAGSAVTPANPETVSAFETGLKSTWADGRVRMNILGFLMKYDDIQRIVQVEIPGESPAQSLFNAAQATISGIEAEFSAIPVKGLRFDVNAGLTDARYDSFVGLTGLQPGQQATDLEFDRVPRWTIYMAASYETELPGNRGKLAGLVSYAWRDHVFTDVLNLRALEQQSFGLLDASIRWTRGGWWVSAFGRNIGNVDFADIRSANTGFNAYGGQPRMYGLEFGIRM